jgi:hypothetical protein
VPQGFRAQSCHCSPGKERANRFKRGSLAIVLEFRATNQLSDWLGCTSILLVFCGLDFQIKSLLS